MSCDVNTAGDLEGYAFGECGPKAARAVEAHLFGCADCAAELRRLRSERRLFRARMEADTAPVPAFEEVLARIEEQAPVRASGGRARIEEQAPVRASGGRSRAVVSAAVAV